jgi:hypothetical protein
MVIEDRAKLAVYRNLDPGMPEVGGAVDPGSDAQDLAMLLYGGMSKGERNRMHALRRPTGHALLWK